MWFLNSASKNSSTLFLNGGDMTGKRSLIVRIGMNILNILPYLAVIITPSIISAATTDGLTTFTGSMNTSVGLVYGYVRVALSIGLMVWAIWLFYQAFFGHDKHGAWWQIVGLIAFVILLNVFPSIYNAITGASVTTTSP
jgi:hypothetical protein